MSEIAIGSHPGRTLIALDRIALGAVLVLPLLLLHAHGIAEVAIAIADLCFLARSAITRDWAWTRTPWLLIAWAWCAWVIFCSLPIPALGTGQGGARSLIQALVLVRFPILVVAMEYAILRPPNARRWCYWVIAASAAYIAAHAMFQFFTGYNFYGAPVGSDGVLSGPFRKPRAGPPFARILLPAIIPWAAAMLTRPGLRPVIQAWLVLIGGVCVALLIGQRMPFLLTCFGLAIVGSLLPRLRWGVLAAGIAAVALLAASPVVAPKEYHRLVVQFSDQLEHFAASPYGELYARALEIGIRNPITGLGAEGFWTGCREPIYFNSSFGPAGSPDTGCWHHPHNYYLEALTTGGFPGLIMFTALGVAWLVTIGRGLWRQPDPLRAALFAAAAIQFWPIASTTGYTAMPVAGWSFMLLGWGLAEARWPNRRRDPI